MRILAAEATSPLAEVSVSFRPQPHCFQVIAAGTHLTGDEMGPALVCTFCIREKSLVPAGKGTSIIQVISLVTMSTELSRLPARYAEIMIK